jgi:hypothetical protein
VSKQIKKYTTGFTSGALLNKEAQIVIDNLESAQKFFLGEEDLNQDVLPNNSEASKKRVKHELEKRLRAINDFKFIDLYRFMDQKNKNLILFYAACRLYPLLADFMLEVVLYKWNNIDFELTSDDFQNFIYKKMTNHEELTKVTENTRNKLSQVALKMMTQLGMLKKNKLIKLYFNEGLLKSILENGDQWFLKVLLMSDNEINQLLE